MTSSSVNFNIAESCTEQQLSAAGFQVPVATSTQYSRWRFLYNLYENTKAYITNIYTYAPKVNFAIQKMDKLIEDEIDRQKKEIVDWSACLRHEQRCKNMLANIETHEKMVRKFAEKLFFKESSPILSSHKRAKEMITARISTIAYHKTVCMPRTLGLDELKTKIVNQEIADLSNVDPIALTRLYDRTDIAPNNSPEFLTFFRLHLILHDSSPTYREMLAEIRSNSKVTRPDLPENTPVTILPITDFPFEACWNNSLHAIRINTEKNRMDTSEGLGEIGSLIAFEMTNAFQEQSLSEINKSAWEGKYELAYETLGVDEYITKREEVEDRGISIQRKIIAEARQNSPQFVNQSWDRYRNYVAKSIILYFRNEHGDYYRKHYIKNIRPHVDEIFKNGTPLQRIAYDFQLRMRKELEVEENSGPLYKMDNADSKSASSTSS